MLDFSEFDFKPVMDYPDDLHVFDLSEKRDPAFIRSKDWAVGKYNEERRGMYTAPHYEGKRNIHMGIDIWAKAGSPVYAFYEGEVIYQQNNDRNGDYGPTIVTKYVPGDQIIYALYGHLSFSSLSLHKVGDRLEAGEKIAELGAEEENGGWVPHLHFQLSVEDPGEADMPGVVSGEDHSEALKTFPDPRLVLGKLY